jgi:hypothetical protein
MYVTLLGFFESDAAAGDLPAVPPGDVHAHRRLVDAIERGQVPEPEGPG